MFTTWLKSTKRLRVGQAFEIRAGFDLNLLKLDFHTKDKTVDGMFSIRQSSWKLELCAGSGGWSKGGGPESPQLYDMTADVGETKNLGTQQREVVARLTKLLESYVANGRSMPGASQTNDAKIVLHKPAGKASKE